MTGARVVVVEDEGLLRSLVVLALQRDAGVSIVGEAADGDACLEVVRATQPDIVVLDLGIPGLAGARLVEAIRRAVPEVRVVIYSARAEDEGSPTGADGHVLKDGDLGTLVRFVERLAPTGAVDRQASVRLSASTGSPAQARRRVSAICDEWGCGDEVHAALLVVSELVTNAVTHAASPCEVRISLTATVLRIEVQDRSTASPEPSAGDLDAEGGRGLLLVAALSDAWGVDPADGGKCIWAELVRSDPRGHSGDQRSSSET